MARCSGGRWPTEFGCGCSSGVEHDLAKVGVEGSNPFARSRNSEISSTFIRSRIVLSDLWIGGSSGEAIGKDLGLGCGPRRSSIIVASAIRAVRLRARPPIARDALGLEFGDFGDDTHHLPPQTIFDPKLASLQVGRQWWALYSTHGIWIADAGKKA